MGPLAETWNYIDSHWPLIGELTQQHVAIVGMSCGIAIILGVAIGVYISGKGREKSADIALYLASILMTVPSLAMFGLLIPILAALLLPMIGYLPAIIALVLYALLPIIRNTYTGLKEVDPAMIEAGKGMGMTGRQLLLKVKLPLSIPVIMAGLRQAIVMNIGIAAIASIIGAGGLGRFIWGGIHNLRFDKILTGTIFVSILSLTADGIMALIEKGVTSKGIRINRQK